MNPSVRTMLCVFWLAVCVMTSFSDALVFLTSKPKDYLVGWYSFIDLWYDFIVMEIRIDFVFRGGNSELRHDARVLDACQRVCCLTGGEHADCENEVAVVAEWRGGMHPKSTC